MPAPFDPLSLPRHIHIARAGRGTGGTPLAAMVCSVCGGEEATADTPEALRDTAARFVPTHMECTPVVAEEEE
jgi:hypothetical protein